MESLLDIKSHLNIDSQVHTVKIIGCEIDQQFLDWKARNIKVVKSLDLEEVGIIERKMMTITAVINRDTFFTEEILTLELVICNGTSKMAFDHFYIDLIVTVEYIYDKKSMIGRIQKYKQSMSSLIQYVMKKHIAPGQRVEFVRDFEIPANFHESTLIKDSIVRTSYSLQISIPNRTEKIVFPLYIINSQGTKLKRQNIQLGKTQSKEQVVDDFELVDEDVGFVDQVKRKEKSGKILLVQCENTKYDKGVEEISKLLKEK